MAYLIQPFFSASPPSPDIEPGRESCHYLALNTIGLQDDSFHPVHPAILYTNLALKALFCPEFLPVC